MKRWQITLGISLVVLGIFSLFNQLFPDLRIGRFTGPLILIGLGIFVILRPRMAGPEVKVLIPILGDMRNTGAWEVTRHEIWWFVGSNRLDFSEAVFPEGEGKINIIGFVNDIQIILPEDVGLQVLSTAFVNDFHGLGGKQERFLSTLEEQSLNFTTAEKRVVVESIAFVAEVKVRPTML